MAVNGVKQRGQIVTREISFCIEVENAIPVGNNEGLVVGIDVGGLDGDSDGMSVGTDAVMVCNVLIWVQSD